MLKPRTLNPQWLACGKLGVVEPVFLERMVSGTHCANGRRDAVDLRVATD